MHDKCPYAEAIGKPIYFITSDIDGNEVCGFCHASKKVAVTKTATTTVRK